VACVAAVAVNAPSWIVQATAVAAIIGIAVTAALVVVAWRLVRLPDSPGRGPPPAGVRAEPILMRLDDFAVGLTGRAGRSPSWSQPS